MAVTMADVRQWLERAEPNYKKAAATLGADALPYLEQLVDDPRLGPGAVCMASFVGGPQATALLLAATSHPNDAVRFQAACGARNLDGQHAIETLLQALNDPDVGVRHAAVRSVGVLKGTGQAPPMVIDRVSSMTASEPDRRTRDVIDVVLRMP